jgi:hypothetical protein
MEELLVMADMLISVLAPTGDKTTDTYLISKGEKGVKLTFEDLRTIAKIYLHHAPVVSLLATLAENKEFSAHLWALEGRAEYAEQEASELRYRIEALSDQDFT